MKAGHPNASLWKHRNNVFHQMAAKYKLMGIKHRLQPKINSIWIKGCVRLAFFLWGQQTWILSSALHSSLFKIIKVRDFRWNMVNWNNALISSLFWTLQITGREMNPWNREEHRGAMWRCLQGKPLGGDITAEPSACREILMEKEPIAVWWPRN